jgi:hypothetical protein
VREVELNYDSEGVLVITINAPRGSDAEQISERIVQIPELAPYVYKMHFRLE